MPYLSSTIKGQTWSTLCQANEQPVHPSIALSIARGHGLRLGERLDFIPLKSKERMISWEMEEVP